MSENRHDLIVIGAGPGGYVAAIRAAQLGMSVACVEREERLGGTCLRVGCIPSKALLESSERYHEVQHGLEAHGIKVEGASFDLSSMLKRKEKIVGELTKGVEHLFKKNKITWYRGNATITAPGKVSVEGSEKSELEAENIIVATGSVPKSLPGIEIDHKFITDSTDALSYTEVPKHLVVVGAGFIGMELGSVWKRLGAEVTIVEYFDHIIPGLDGEMSKEALRAFKKQGFNFELSARVMGAEVKKGKVSLQIEGVEDVTGDKVLMSVGRAPNTSGLGLEALGIELDNAGRIPVQDHFKTSVSGIYAIGDVIAGPMLAHKASDEGVACVEFLATGYGHVNYDAIPGVVYTEPEIANVGRTEEQLKDEGVEYNKGQFLFRANGRAKALNQIDGKVKVLADKQTDRVLGIHIIGPRAGDLIAECAVAMEFGASSEDIARACHAHPTLSEVVKEAALDALGRVIHA